MQIRQRLLVLNICFGAPVTLKVTAGLDGMPWDSCGVNWIDLITPKLESQEQSIFTSPLNRVLGVSPFSIDPL